MISVHMHPWGLGRHGRPAEDQRWKVDLKLRTRSRRSLAGSGNFLNEFSVGSGRMEAEDASVIPVLGRLSGMLTRLLVGRWNGSGQGVI